MLDVREGLSADYDNSRDFENDVDLESLVDEMQLIVTKIYYVLIRFSRMCVNLCVWLRLIIFYKYHNIDKNDYNMWMSL